MFEWGLLENAIDYLREAVRRLEGEIDRRDLKYAILNLGSGLELLLKERLRREDWRQLFDNPEEADEILYERATFHSVSIWDTIDRLNELTTVNIPSDQRRQIEALRNRRNPLEHFRIRASHEAVFAIASRALGFAIVFIAQELDDETIDEELRDELEEIREALPRLEEFVEHRMAELEPQLEGEAKTQAVIDCPRCFQQAAIAGDGLRCLFCGFSAGLDEAEATASEWVGQIWGINKYRVIKEGGEWPVYKCPECDHVTMIDKGPTGDLEPGERFVCFACGSAWPGDAIERCLKCGEPFNESNGYGTVCTDCFDYVVSSSD